MYKVWIKRNFREIQSIGEETYKIVVEKLMESYLQVSHSITLLRMILYVPLPILLISLKFLLIHTVYILWSVFHVCASKLLIGCTYNKENGKNRSIWWYHNNQTRICQSLFWNMIHTYRTGGCQQCLHLHRLELPLWLNHVWLTLFFRNMAFASHTGKVLKFWPQILNLLEIWAQMMYGSSHVGSLLVNLILGLELWNGCIKGYRPGMKIPSSDPESAHQIGPDDIWFMSFGEGNPTPSWCSKLICL